MDDEYEKLRKTEEASKQRIAEIELANRERVRAALTAAFTEELRALPGVKTLIDHIEQVAGITQPPHHGGPFSHGILPICDRSWPKRGPLDY